MKTDEERFFSKINKTEDCWLWTASVFSNGYGQFKMGDKNRLAHRVAFEIFTGPIPDGATIDHKCGCRSCVNPQHLRLATLAENNFNRSRRSDNMSGFKGVAWHKGTQKWQSQIKLMGKQRHLGLFSTPELAYAAYCEAAQRTHGEFANLG